jgi:hypothetical protein
MMPEHALQDWRTAFFAVWRAIPSLAFILSILNSFFNIALPSYLIIFCRL